MKVEPVAWLHREGENTMSAITRARQDQWIIDEHWADATPLYTIPPGYALVRVEQVKDAERFDFLRKQTGSIRFGDHSLCGQFEGQRGLFNEFIDAAITAAKGE